MVTGVTRGEDAVEAAPAQEAPGPIGRVDEQELSLCPGGSAVQVQDDAESSGIADLSFAQVEPEDWYFSRLLHELGLKVGCTRKVRLTHRGPHEFTNADVWGQPFDREYVGRSVLAVVRVRRLECDRP